MSTTEAVGIERNSLALAVSGVVTAGVGLVYWIVMGRLYPTAEVGAAAAVITTATMLAAFGNLGLGAYFERFLPVAGTASLRLPRRGLVVGAAVGALLSIGFLFVGPVSEMFSDSLQLALFPLVVIALSSFALLDHVTIALQQAHWAARKNITHAVAKLIGAVAVASFAGRLGIVMTWVLTAIVLSGVTWMVASRVLRVAAETGSSSPTGSPPVASAPVGLPARSEQCRFIAGNYGVYVASALTPLLLPPIVIGHVGADRNAYFAIVWSLVSAVLVLLTMLMGPYVAAVTAEPARAMALTRRFVLILAVVSGAAAIGLVTVGPLLLRLAGPGYAAEGAPLMRLAAIAIPFAACGMAFTAICRVRNRLLPALLIQTLNATVMLTLCAVWIRAHGLPGAGWGLIVAEGMTAILVIIPVTRALTGRGPALGGSITRPAVLRRVSD